MGHRALLVLAGLAALPLVGCGGGVPGFGTMSSSDLRPPGITSPAQARRPAARSLWEVERLRQAPLGVQVLADRQERLGDARLTVREVTFNSEIRPGSPEKLFAYFALPTRDTVTPPATDASQARLPALVLVHDLGETASLEAARTWAARGYAVLALDLPGKGPGREKSRSGGPEMTEEAIFKTGGGGRESYLFHSVGAVLRAVSFLREQKEVDPTKIALMGDAWGSVTAALTGTIDDRVHALVATYGAGSLTPSIPALAKLKALNSRDRQSWTKSFDPLAYPRAEQPAALFVGATNDKKWSPESLVETERRYNGPHALALAPGKVEHPPAPRLRGEREGGGGAGTLSDQDHELDAPTRAAVAAWLDHTLKGTPLPTVASTVTAEGDAWTVRTSGRQPARVVSLFYGAGSGDWSQREWKEVKATRAEEHRWTATLPADAQGAPFLVRVEDASGAALTAEPAPPAAPKQAATTAKPAGS